MTLKEKYEHIKTFLKDVELMEKYHNDPKEVYKEIEQYENESVRLLAVKRLVESVTELKNDVVKAWYKMSDMIEDVETQYNELVKERKEVLKEVENTRLISKGLMLQLKAVSEKLQEGNFNPELVKQIFSETKQIHFRCSCCKKEFLRTGLESILDNQQCSKCKIPYDLGVAYVPA